MKYKKSSGWDQRFKKWIRDKFLDSQSEQVIFHAQRNVEMSEYFYRFFGMKIAKVCIPLKLSANMVTILGSILIFIASILYIFESAYWHKILFVILIQIGLIADYADGIIARLTKKSSPIGFMLDMMFDDLTEALMFICVALAVFLKSGDPLVIYLSVGAIIAMFIYQLSTSYFYVASSKEEVYTIYNNAKSNFFLREFSYTRSKKFIIISLAVLLSWEIYAFALLILYAIVAYVITSYLNYKKLIDDDKKKVKKKRRS